MILSNNLIECSNKAHSTKRAKRSHTTRNVAARATVGTGITFSDIISKMEAIFVKSKTNILYFIIGILSEFIPGLDAVFTNYIKLDEATKVTDKFLPCFEKFKTSVQDTKNLASSPFSDMEAKSGSAAKGVKFCEEFKKTIFDYFVAAEKEDYADKAGIWDKMTPEWVLTASYNIGGKIASLDKFCKIIATSRAPKTKAIIIKKFGSVKEYEKECLYFHEKDCDNYNPAAAGIKVFAQKAYSYVSGIVDVGKCVYTLFDSGADPNIIKAKLIIGKLFTVNNFIDAAMGGMVGLVANILTFGIWGGLKGGYYIVQLVNKIASYREAAKLSTNAFQIGKIIGNCIMIVKSFIAGRRRLMKRKYRK